MKGKYHIEISNSFVTYDFFIKRNYTFIRGDSGTGKTTLIDLIRLSKTEPESVNLKSDVNLKVISNEEEWNSFYKLSQIGDPDSLGNIVFFDESQAYMYKDKFLSEVKKSDNYYVIVSRSDFLSKEIVGLPYSAHEIYKLETDESYSEKPVYNKLVEMYPSQKINTLPKIILTEDKRSGNQFFSNIFSGKCVDADGNGNIYNKLQEFKGDNVLIVADGAAFGPYIHDIHLYTVKHPNIKLYLPESFEYMLLNSCIFDDTDIPNILKMPWNYINSAEYSSWERYFTRKLSDLTRNTKLQYSKRKFNLNFLEYKDSILERNNLSVFLTGVTKMNLF